MDRPTRHSREKPSHRAASHTRSTRTDDHRIPECSTLISRRTEPRESYKYQSYMSVEHGHRTLESGSSSRNEPRESYKYHAYMSVGHDHRTLKSGSSCRTERDTSYQFHAYKRDSYDRSKATRWSRSGRSDERRDEIRPFEYFDLKLMVEKKTPEDLTETLARDGARLKELLRGGRKLLDPGMVEMLLGVFGKMLDADRQINSSMARVIQLIDEYNFDEVICHFIRDLQTEPCQRRRMKAPFHIENALKIARALLTDRPAQSKRKVVAMTHAIRAITVDLRLDGRCLHEIEGMLRGTKRKCAFDKAEARTKSHYKQSRRQAR